MYVVAVRAAGLESWPRFFSARAWDQAPSLYLSVLAHSYSRDASHCQPLPVHLDNFFPFALGRGSFCFFRIALHKCDCRGPQKVTEGAIFRQIVLYGDTTSIRARFVLMYVAHPNAEYDYVFTHYSSTS